MPSNKESAPGIISAIVVLILILWAVHTGHWGWAALIFFGLVFAVILLAAWLETPGTSQPAVLTDTTPVSESVKIARPAGVVWPVLERSYSGTLRRSLLRPWLRQIRIGRDRVILEWLSDQECLVTHIARPVFRSWTDGSFGYTLRPSMRQKLEEIKRQVESTNG